MDKVKSEIEPEIESSNSFSIVDYPDQTSSAGFSIVDAPNTESDSFSIVNFSETDFEIDSKFSFVADNESEISKNENLA